MIARDRTVADSVLAWRASGRITRDDVRAFQDELRRAAPPDGGAQVLIDLTGMTGADLDAIWQDAKHSLEYVRRIDRVAVVGDAEWEQRLTQLAGMVPGIDARYFEPDSMLEARSWLGAG